MLAWGMSVRGCLGYVDWREQIQPREDTTNPWTWVLDYVKKGGNNLSTGGHTPLAFSS